MSGERQLFLAYPGDLETRTGGYLYDRRVALELEGRGWQVERMSLPIGFPHPSAEELTAAGVRLSTLPRGALALIDGLALGAMPPALTAELAAHVDLVALVHHPLCLETGLSVTAATELERSERAALAVVRTVIVTSTSTARSIASMFGVPGERISVAVPGTDAAPLASGSIDGVVRMLAVGTVTPRKGHAILVRALAGLEGRWQLELAGSLERDPATVGDLRALIGDYGLADRIRFLGELDWEALAAAFDRADLFVSASFYEGYGMAIAEALARGLPIVAATGGAVRDTVGPDAGLLVPPDDPTALRGALRRFLTDSDLAANIRRGARASRERLPSWSDTADVVEATLLGAVH